jgi:hypothetical protein
VRRFVALQPSSLCREPGKEFDDTLTKAWRTLPIRRAPIRSAQASACVLEMACRFRVCSIDVRIEGRLEGPP